MEILVIIGTVVLASVIVFGWSCFEAWLGCLAINWLCATLGIAFSITFCQAFVVLFIINLIGSRFTVNK